MFNPEEKHSQLRTAMPTNDVQNQPVFFLYSLASMLYYPVESIIDKELKAKYKYS